MELQCVSWLALLSSDVSTVLSTLCLLVSICAFIINNKYNYWSKRGIKGPKPWPILGNFLEFLRPSRNEQSLEWTRKYGKLHGIYYGITPQLFVADAEVYQQICVKDFDVFPNHEINEFFNKIQQSFILFTKDDHWRRMRALQSPTFTSGKIKRMFKLINICANDLLESCGEESAMGKADVNLKDVYRSYAMDSIATCCYGLKLDKKSRQWGEFVQSVVDLFYFSIWRLFVSTTVPGRLLHLIGFHLSPDSCYRKMAATVEQLIERRRKASADKKFDDYLQLLIDAKMEENLELNEIDASENHHAGATGESLLAGQRKMVETVKQLNRSKMELTDFEILSSAMFLLAVGVQTTSTLLTNASYVLAFHQEVQDRLYEEVRSIAELDADKKGNLFDYERLTTLKYLDAFVSETLRRLPPVNHMDRIASRDYCIDKYNLEIPAGSKVYLLLQSLMNDPDYWQEPERFNPDRFLPENRHKIVPGSYCPFGMGPRYCLGMRFSLTETKLALAKLIMNFRFEPAPGTQWPPANKVEFEMNMIANPIVRLKLRSD